MTDIRPRIENGEPVCAGNECTKYGKSCASPAMLDVPWSTPCVPALRQQRDEARKAHCVSAAAAKATAYDMETIPAGLVLTMAGILYPEAARRLFPDKETR